MSRSQFTVWSVSRLSVAAGFLACRMVLTGRPGRHRHGQTKWVDPAATASPGQAQSSTPPDDERVAGHLELVLAADLRDRGLDRRVLELDHRPARLAHQVLVLWVPVVVLVVRLRPDLQLPEHPGIDQLGQGAVDGRPGDRQPGLFQVLGQLVGVEVAVAGEDVLDQVLLLAGEPLGDGSAGQELPELLDRGLANMDGG